MELRSTAAHGVAKLCSAWSRKAKKRRASD
jgi:hypothetical protein